jgi:hypothetical protein
LTDRLPRRSGAVQVQQPVAARDVNFVIQHDARALTCTDGLCQPRRVEHLRHLRSLTAGKDPQHVAHLDLHRGQPGPENAPAVAGVEALAARGLACVDDMLMPWPLWCLPLR